MNASITAVRPRHPHATGRTYVRLTGDVDPADRFALERLRVRLRDAVRVHVDLWRVRFGGALLVDWLLAVRHGVEANEGRLTLDRLPLRLERLLRALHLQGAFEITESPVDVHPSPGRGEGPPVPCDLCA